MRHLVMSAIILAVLSLISCAKTQPPPTSVSAPATTTIDTAKLFATNCAVCHGSSRQGVSGLGPALTPTSLAELSDAEIRNTILKGRPNTAMAGFEGRLSSEEIDALLHFIKSTSP